MENPRQPIESQPTVQSESQTQPIEPKVVTVSSEEYKRLLSYEVAEQAKEHVKSWAKGLMTIPNMAKASFTPVRK
jgi:hypothetical protein